MDIFCNYFTVIQLELETPPSYDLILKSNLTLVMIQPGKDDQSFS